MSTLAVVLRRDRAVVALALALLAALGWWYLVAEARRMSMPGMAECFGIKMNGPEMNRWPLSSLWPLFFMWALMMMAMMLPSAAPMILTFTTVARNRRRLERPYTPVAIFVAGYLLIWCGFSALAATGQWLLHRAALLSPMMISSSVILGGLLLLAAGFFQFSLLKQSCLTHCRSPLTFIMAHWREGWRGAFVMGLEHGAFCTGCCWALMCLLFVLGVMNIFWIIALSLIVLLEKILPIGRWLSFTFGLALIFWGVWVLTTGLLLRPA